MNYGVALSKSPRDIESSDAPLSVLSIPIPTPCAIPIPITILIPIPISDSQSVCHRLA